MTPDPKPALRFPLEPQARTEPGWEPAALAHQEALDRLPRVTGWDRSSEGHHFACPMPAYRMAHLADDPDHDRDPVPMVEVCGYPLGLETEDGSDFWDDLQDPSWGAPCWKVVCQGGHVLLMADGVDDVPSAELAFSPDVVLSVLLDLSQQGQRVLYATPGRSVTGQSTADLFPEPASDG